jgi:DNA-binding phage protein
VLILSTTYGARLTMKISELEKFDAADLINNEEDIFHYLKAILEENDPSALAEALDTIYRSQAYTKFRNPN